MRAYMIIRAINDLLSSTRILIRGARKMDEKIKQISTILLLIIF